MLTGFDKAIIALLGSLVTIAATFGLNVSWATPEVVSSVGGILTAMLVYAIPNRKA